jgi:hypothetical protein
MTDARSIPTLRAPRRIPSPRAPRRIPSPRASWESRERGRRATVALLLLLLLLGAASPARADEPKPPAAPPALAGRWLATADDGRVFAGTWSATVAAATPNAARGEWSLVDETGVHVLMHGTWSARKTAGGLRGSWAAHTADGGGASGTWQADAPTTSAANTFREMLALPARQQIGGTWRTRHASGHWWLKPQTR